MRQIVQCLAMESYRLSKAELSKLKVLHRRTPKKRYADRIKAVILLGSGWSVGAVAEALPIDRNTARQYYKLYQSGSTDHLLTINYRGSQSFLTEEQLDALDEHLQETLVSAGQRGCALCKNTLGRSLYRQRDDSITA